MSELPYTAIKRIHVFYHSADFDGLMSGAILKFFIEKNGFKLAPKVKEVIMHPWDYGDPVPEGLTLEDYIVMVDITIPQFVGRKRSLWIDHHVGSIREHHNKYMVHLSRRPVGFNTDTSVCYLLDGVAACRLAYQFCTENIYNLPNVSQYTTRQVAEPRLVNLLGEFDIWDKRNPDAEILQYGMVGTTVDDLVKYLSMGGSLYMSEFENKKLTNGHVAQEYMKAYNADLASRNAYRVEWEGMNVLALNHSRGNSITFDSLDQTGIDALCLWRFDGKMIKVSLYRTKHANEAYENTGENRGPGGFEIHQDMSVIATKHGGGGHRGAAGFEVHPTMIGDYRELFLPSELWK